jgi:peptidyl-prolyl cis-trans isomerase SurA
MRHIPVLIFFVFTLASPFAAHAQRVDTLPGVATGHETESHIIAVVNDSVITSVDLDSRIHMAMLASGLPQTQEVAAHLFPQVLRSLIDEQLQMQEAKRLGISVSDDEVNQAMDRIAAENNMPGGMKAYVAAHGLSPDVLVTQLRNTLSWNKVIQRELRSRVEVGDDEVDAALARMRANAGKEEYLISEIFLAVDNPQDEDQVHQFADKLVGQIKSGGNFASIAHQFSQSTGAANGGEIGWVQEGQLATELNRAITTMAKGEISAPIRSASGFHILAMRDKRTVAVSDGGDVLLKIKQVFRPFSDSSQNTVTHEAARLHNTVLDCKNLESEVPEKFPGWRVQDMGEVKLSKAPAQILDKIRDVPEGKSSDTVITDKSAILFFVCERKVTEDTATRTAVMASIGTEKMELQARRLLRDLRRDAYLDVRLAKPGT